jgi:hypothetical protein
MPSENKLWKQHLCHRCCFCVRCRRRLSSQVQKKRAPTWVEEEGMDF